ncbi:MAG: Stp1/IreP family PP2C-type Ser/Thr phosphatase [Lachnospiraceae bacterium]|nr:Stp1/IreP family PP2C-type Ser/Thr phosphatase [Lachnospiraceae bacterium]
MRAFGMTHVGQKRSINQDYIYYTDEPVGLLPNLYIVADGMGGHKAGDKASSFAVERFVELAKEFSVDQPLFLMKEVMEQVNQELLDLASGKPEYEGMGTTFVAASILDDQLNVMNVGDSRLYLMGEELTQITKDHSLVEELVRSGQLTKEEARIHPQKNLITKALGAEMSVEPDFFQLEMKNDDRILMCSDGLSNMVEDKRIEDILKNFKEPEAAVNQLISCANEQGGLDNIAAVVVKKEEKR